MKNKLLLFLNKLSSRFITRAIYWKIRALWARLRGTTAEEQRWLKKGAEGNIKDPHRQFLAEKIKKYAPFSKIIEVGCNYGTNLLLLSEQFPNLEMVGIDISPIAIQEGKEILARRRAKNIKLIIGKADELNQFKEKSFDIVFTDATLLYIGPDKIKKVVEKMINLARRAVIFTEWHTGTNDPYGLGAYHFGCWKRNYVNLLKQFVPENKITLTKITKEMWPHKNWQQFGYFIEVSL